MLLGLENSKTTQAEERQGNRKEISELRVKRERPLRKTQCPHFRTAQNGQREGVEGRVIVKAQRQNDTHPTASTRVGTLQAKNMMRVIGFFVAGGKSP